MDFQRTPAQEAMLARAREVTAAFDLDYWREQDRAETYPRDFLAACTAEGWNGAVIPQEYGGLGWGVTEAALLLGAICESGAGTSGASPVHLAIFPPLPLVRHGSEEQKARYLPLLARGELWMSFGVTEAEAGLDTSRISTRAERHGDRWVLNGSKAWLSNAGEAQKALVLARTSERDPARPFAGLTLFFVDLDPRACRLEWIDKLGRNAIGSWAATFHDLEVADSDVIGTLGQGFYHLLESLNPERIVIAMEAVGIGRAALRLASDYAKERRVFAREIGRNQAVAHPLAHAWAQLHAAELLALEAAWRYDNGLPCGAEANAAKLLAAEAGFAACDAALQTFGGRGYRKDHHIERLWREVRLYKIAPITQEMVLNYLAEHVLGLPRGY